MPDADNNARLSSLTQNFHSFLEKAVPRSSESFVSKVLPSWRVLCLATLLVGIVGGASAQTLVDDFEDGDVSEWSSASGRQTFSWSATSTTPISGSYSGRAYAADDGYFTTTYNFSGTVTSDPWVKIKLKKGTGGQSIFGFKTDGGSLHGQLYINYDNTNSDVEWIGDSGIVTVASDAVQSGNTYTVHFATDFANDEVEIFIDGTSYGTYTLKAGLPDSYGIVKARLESGSSGEDITLYDGIYADENFPYNDAPQFNSTSITPDPPLIGENVSYSAEVYDSDGSIQYTNLTLEYGGSTVVSDSKRAGTTTLSWNDIYKPNSGNKWLNATLETVDDKGAVTTKEINRYLSDEAPSVSLQDPGNQSYFRYDVPLSFSVSDSDSEPGEDWTCTVDKDGVQVDSFYLKEGTNSTYTGTISSDKGQHNAKVSCSDGSGNTGSDQVDYTVKRFRLNSVSANSQVYETTKQQYTTTMKTGSMINKVETTLNYAGTDIGTVSNQPSGVSTFSLSNTHTIGLVSSNQTQKNWYTSTTYNYTKLNGNYATETVNSTSQSQEILWSYYIGSADTIPNSGNYIEKQDLRHQATVHTETKKASLSGVTTYKRGDGSTDQMVLVSNTSTQQIYQGTLDTGLADTFNQSTFQVESSITVEFQGETRTVQTGNDPVNVYRIRLEKTSQADNAKALVFDTDYEENGYNVKTDLRMDISLFKNRDEIVRRFSYISKNKQEHSFYIQPSWASYKMRTLEYPDQKKFDIIQYEPSYDGGVLRSYFFPRTQTISNTTTTVPLLTINRSETTKVDFEIDGANGDPATQVTCRVDRKFPGTGTHKTVFMIKTGSNGYSQSFAEVNEIYYRITCFDQGEVIDTFGDQIMQDPMRLQIGGGQSENTLDYAEKFDATCSTNTTGVTCSYQSQSEKLKEAVLTVERKEVVQDITVCRVTNPSATGTLSCIGNTSYDSDEDGSIDKDEKHFINASKNSYSYKVKAKYLGDVTIFDASGTLTNQKLVYGAAGIILTAVIYMFIFAASSFNVLVGIILGNMWLLLSSMLKFSPLTPVQRATLIGVTIVIAAVITK